MHAVSVRKTQPDYRKSLLQILPEQGCWSEEDYLRLTDRTNRPVEFTDGHFEFLPMPNDQHQAIAGFLFHLLRLLMNRSGGKVRFAGSRLRIRPGKMREPDILFLKSDRDSRWGADYWTGADLVMEVVSPDDPDRDLVEKRRDYAEGKIPEYWIVDPREETITVLVLGKKNYRKHGVFRRGQQAAGVILDDFAVDVAEVFDAK